MTRVKWVCVPLHRPLIGTLAVEVWLDTLERLKRQKSRERTDICCEKWIVYIVSTCGRRKEEKGGKREKRRSQRKSGRGGQGRRRGWIWGQLCWQSDTFDFRLRQTVSKWMKLLKCSHRASVRSKALEKLCCCNMKLVVVALWTRWTQCTHGIKKKTRVCLLSACLAVFTSSAIDCNLNLFTPLNILSRICSICLGSISCLVFFCLFSFPLFFSLASLWLLCET